MEIESPQGEAIVKELMANSVPTEDFTAKQKE